MRPHRLLAAALLCLLAATTAAAQDGAAPSAYRQGVWIGFGLGPGHARLDCGRCGDLPDGDAWRGGAGHSGFLAIGGTPRRDLLVGGEVNFYVLRSSDRPWSDLYGRSYDVEQEALLGTANVTVQLYPLVGSPLFVRGGAGYGFSSLSTRVDLIGPVEWSHDSDGASLLAGLGYDVVVGGSYAVVPFAGVVQLLARGARWEGGSGPANPRYAQVGVALVRY
jgi:hypothetical protein